MVGIGVVGMCVDTNDMRDHVMKDVGGMVIA